MSERNLRVIGRVGKCETAICKNFGKLGKYKDGFCKMCGSKVKGFVLVEKREEEKIWTVIVQIGERK